MLRAVFPFLVGWELDHPRSPRTAPRPQLTCKTSVSLMGAFIKDGLKCLQTGPGSLPVSVPPCHLLWPFVEMQGVTLPAPVGTCRLVPWRRPLGSARLSQKGPSCRTSAPSGGEGPSLLLILSRTRGSSFSHCTAGPAPHPAEQGPSSQPPPQSHSKARAPSGRRSVLWSHPPPNFLLCLSTSHAERMLCLRKGKKKNF